MSLKLVTKVTELADKDLYKTIVLRFSMVVLLTIVMTVFSVVIAWSEGCNGNSRVFLATFISFSDSFAAPDDYCGTDSSTCSAKISEIKFKNPKEIFLGIFKDE